MERWGWQRECTLSKAPDGRPESYLCGVCIDVDGGEERVLRIPIIACIHIPLYQGSLFTHVHTL